MTAAQLRRPLPPVLVVVLVVLMTGLRWLAPIVEISSMPVSLIGLVPLGVGAVVNVGNARRFDRLGTNIVTFEDPGTLVVDGWFSRSRNPMYLGFLLMLSGVATLLGVLSAWIGPVAFFVAANSWYIPFEERRLAATFGSDYEVYRNMVRRWI